VTTGGARPAGQVPNGEAPDVTKINLSRGEITILVSGWQTDDGVRLEIVAKKQLTDEQLMELARLTRLNTQLLLKLAVNHA
jgi:hypothetical protein